MSPVTSSFVKRPFLAAVFSGLLLGACSAEAPADATAQSASAQFSEPNYDADTAKFMAVLDKFEDTGLFAAEERMETIRDLARNEREHFISGLMRAVQKEGAESHALLEGISLALGYDSIEAFEADGDAVYQAVAVITFKRIEAATYKDIAGASTVGRDVWLENAEYGAMARMIYATPETLITQVEPHHDTLVIDRGAADAADNPRLQNFYAYLAALPETQELMPAMPPDERAELDQMTNPEALVTDPIHYIVARYPVEMEIMTSVVTSYGFQSLDDWAATGDKIALGMIVADIKRERPQDYEKALSRSDEAMAKFSEQDRVIIKFLKAIPDDEMAFYDSNLDRFTEIVAGL